MNPTSTYANLPWILYPGLYPGGLDVEQGTTAYLMPGIYWIGGGGLQVKNGGNIITVASEADARAMTSVSGGGVMIYNSQLPSIPAGPIVLDGSDATVKMKALDPPESSPDYKYNDMVIFQDRNVSLPGDDITLNGSASTTEVEGLIYAAQGDVKLNGSGGNLTVDQIIASTFQITGADGSTITVLKRTDFESVIIAAGLVE